VGNRPGVNPRSSSIARTSVSSRSRFAGHELATPEQFLAVLGGGRRVQGLHRGGRDESLGAEQFAPGGHGLTVPGDGKNRTGLCVGGSGELAADGNAFRLTGLGIDAHTQLVCGCGERVTVTSAGNP